MNRVSLTHIPSNKYEIVLEELEARREDVLPMVFGTRTAAIAETAWMEADDESHLWLRYERAERSCLLGLRIQGSALWFSSVLPSGWDDRFEIFGEAIPQVVNWFRDQSEYEYLYGKLDASDTPATVLSGYLPALLSNGFQTEYRMWMRRPEDADRPHPISLPEGYTQDHFHDDNLDEVAELVSAVYESEGVDFSLADAREEVEGVQADELFRRSAMPIREGQGQLVGVAWCYGWDPCYPGEICVRKDHQGAGLGRYLLNECVLQLMDAMPGTPIDMCTCREWTKAVRLYESYGFVPTDTWVYVSLSR